MKITCQGSVAMVLASAFLAFAVVQKSAIVAQEPGAAKVNFGRDIKPILSDTCFKCHGPDEHDRKADLRLDTAAGLFEDSVAVVPNDLDDSELYQRIISDDVDLLMPPPDSGRKLTPEQKAIFKRWIEQGAPWENHWSLIPPRKSDIPDVQPTVAKNDSLTPPVNSIDYFITSKLQEHLVSDSVQLSPIADRQTLIRRLALDLTGLPPAPELVQKFVQSESEHWYELLVDELLDSPHYGEHMARYWLDAARYGDTHGLHLDNYREMWPYRDWVVKSFLENKSYRDFTIEQLAGDLLNNPTDEQLIASGFNRAHITTSEGGAIVEEVYVRNVVDRVSTTGTIFMGMTVGCAQCHDHKFDPISQKEFYQLFAFFNNLTDKPMDQNVKDPAPVLKVATDDQKEELNKLKLSFESAKATLAEQIANYQYAEPVDEPVATKPLDEAIDFVWLEDEALPIGSKKEQTWTFVGSKKGKVHSGNKSRVAVAKSVMVQHFFTGAASPLKAMKGDVFFAYVYLDPENTPDQIMLQFNDGDWNQRVYWGENKIDWGTDKSPSRRRAGDLPEPGKWVRLEVAAEDLGFVNLSFINGIAFTQWGGRAYWDSAGIHSKTVQSIEFRSFVKWLKSARETKGEGLPEAIKKLAKETKVKLDETGSQKLMAYFLTTIHPEASVVFAEPLKTNDEMKKAFDDFNNTIPITLISKENPKPKPAFLLTRGEYDQQGDPVERDTPAALPPFSDEYSKDRLGLAKWLTSGSHPLTARVAVNRFWQQVFGTGLVKTSEDFGSQGDLPSHPELLDWLATDFVDHDWDVRRLMKMIVMSAAYRQSSFASPELLALDPENRLLARGPRFRLDAEVLRDQALAVSELLIPTMGGPSVKPPQPDGLWFAVGYSGSNTVRFKKDSGPDKVHRRSIYTFWKRTAPPPQMNTFDAPSREACSVRRERTNTPLQALLLMNDPQYIEAARNLAQLTIDANKPNDSAKTDSTPSTEMADPARQFAQFMFERAMGRSARESEWTLLVKTYQKNLAEFEMDDESAKNLIAIGESSADTSKYKTNELAAWTMIANLIMNMDEFINKN